MHCIILLAVLILSSKERYFLGTAFRGIALIEGEAFIRGDAYSRIAAYYRKRLNCLIILS